MVRRIAMGAEPDEDEGEHGAAVRFERFALALDNPRVGWIDVELTLGAERFGFRASNVLNDPLVELAEMSRFVASGAVGSSRVLFWLEPQGYELRATRDGNGVTVALSRADLAVPALVDGTLVVSCNAEPVSLARTIAAALRQVAPRLGGGDWDVLGDEVIASLPG